MTPSRSRADSKPRAARRRAFTFLEIMFVVVIIGILLAIVGPKLTGKSKKAKIAATQAQLRNVRMALAEYELNVGEFPTTSQGLKALIERPSEIDEDVWGESYLDTNSIPKDAWGREFQYRCPGEHSKDYDLWSTGADGLDNTEDDITSWVVEK